MPTSHGKEAWVQALACLNQISEQFQGTPAGQLALIGLTNIDRVMQGKQPVFDVASVERITGASKSGRPQVAVTKKADDPLCTRVSCGGSLAVGGFYCTYRGSLKESIAVLETVLAELKCLPQELPVSPDNGKQFA